MPVRTISTRIAITGETEYRQALTRLNREQRVLQSELTKTQSAFRNSQNSMEALTAKGKILAELYDLQQRRVKTLGDALSNSKRQQQDYTRQIEDCESALKKAQEELERLKSSTEDTGDEQARLTAEIERLKGELGELRPRQEAASKSVDDFTIKLNKAEAELYDLDSELKKNSAYLEEAEQSADGCATSIDRFGKESQDAMQEVSAAIAGAGIVAALKKIADGFADCVEKSIEFESAIAGVAKTTDMSGVQLSAFADSLQAMAQEIPLSTTELAEIAETAGQLGVQGSESILSFTRVMAMLGTATNMTSSEAATMLAQLANITGMPVDQYENLGSAITALGNTSATTESKIAEMGQRIAASATLAGMSESDILGLAAATTSLGIEAEAGGTSMSTLISQIDAAVQTGKDLDAWAQVAGMSAAQFSEAWGQDAAGALTLFIQGLNDTSATGQSAQAVLSNLGITETRLTRMVLSLAQAGDLLSTSLDTSKTAFEENTALAREAETRYATTESKVQLMKNAFAALEVSIGDELNPAMSKLTDIGTDVAEWATDMVENSGDLVPIMASLTLGFGAFLTVVTAYTVVVPLAQKAIEAFSLAMSTAGGPVTLLIAAITGVVAAVTALALSYDDGIESTEELTEASKNAVKELDNINSRFDDSVAASAAAVSQAQTYTQMLRDLEAQGLDTAQSQSQYRLIVEQLQEIMPELNLTIDEQTHALQGGTEALENNIAALGEYYRQQAYMEKYGDLLKQQATAELELAENANKRKKTELEMSALEEQREEIIEKITKRTEELNEAARKNGEEYGFAVESGAEYDETLIDLNKELDALNEELGRHDDQLGEIDDALEVSRENYDTITESVNSTTDALEGLSQAEIEAITSGQMLTEEQSALYDQINAIGTEIANLESQYNEAFSAAYASIDGQFGLFERLEVETRESVDGMIGSLQSQIDFMNRYAENIQRAMELGVDQGIVEALSDGSVESAAYLQAIVDDGGQRVGELNAKFAQVEEGKNAFATAVAGLKTDFSTQMSAIEGRMETFVAQMDMYEEAADAGSDTVQGFLTSISDRTDDVEAAFSALARRGIAAYNRAAEINSPSRKMMKAGAQTVEPIVLTARAAAPEIEKSYEELARAAQEGYESGALQWQQRSREIEDAAELVDLMMARAVPDRALEAMAESSADYSSILEEILRLLGRQRGSVTNNATISFYGDKPSPARTAREVEKTMRRMLYGY